MNLDYAMLDGLSLRLLGTLVHFVWQGAALALVAALLMALARRASARTRYALLVALFVVTAAAPVATVLVLTDSRVAGSIGEGLVGTSHPRDDALHSTAPRWASRAAGSVGPLRVQGGSHDGVARAHAEGVGSSPDESALTDSLVAASRAGAEDVGISPDESALSDSVLAASRAHADGVGRTVDDLDTMPLREPTWISLPADAHAGDRGTAAVDPAEVLWTRDASPDRTPAFREPLHGIAGTSAMNAPVRAEMTERATPASYSQTPDAAGETPKRAAAILHMLDTVDAYTRSHATNVAFAYLLGVALLLFRLAWALRGGRRLRRASVAVTDNSLLDMLHGQARVLGLRAAPVVAYCERVAVPTVIGVFRPMILLPLFMVTGFTPAQLELILRHELAHIRRYDHLVNLAQRLVEAFLFFHPGVWYISRLIRIEREHCCDDLVLATGGEALAYADSLVRIAEQGFGKESLAAVHMAARPSDLRRRIIRLLEGPAPHLRVTRMGLLLTLMLMLTAGAAIQATTRETPETEPTAAAAVGDHSDPSDPSESPKPLTPEKLTQLLDQLNNPDWWLRQVAVQQLGEARAELAIDSLRHLLADDKEARVRAAAATALGRIDGQHVVGPLAAALKDEEPVMLAAARALAAIGPTDEVMEYLSYAAYDELVSVRIGAIVALSTFETDRAAELMFHGLDRRAIEGFDRTDERPVVKFTAILEQVWAQAPHLKLLNIAERALTRGTDDEAAKAAALLGRLDVPGTTEALERALADPRVQVRKAAVGTLYLAKEAIATPALTQALHDDHFEIRKVAADALRARSAPPTEPADMAAYHVALGNWSVLPTLGEAAIAPLLAAIGSNDADVRQYAASTMGALGLAQFVPALVEALRDSSDGVRLLSAESLGKIGDPAAVAPLIQALSDHHARKAAADSLGAIADPAAVPALVASLRDMEPEVREAAAKALGAIGDPRAIAPLIESLQRDASMRTVNATMESLKTIAKEHAADVLAALPNPNPSMVGQPAGRAQFLSRGDRITPEFCERQLRDLARDLQLEHGPVEFVLTGLHGSGDTGEWVAQVLVRNSDTDVALVQMPWPLGQTWLGHLFKAVHNNCIILTNIGTGEEQQLCPEDTSQEEPVESVAEPEFSVGDPPQTPPREQVDPTADPANRVPLHMRKRGSSRGDDLPVPEAPTTQPEATAPIPSSVPGAPSAPTAPSVPLVLSVPSFDLIQQLQDEDWWLRKIAAQQMADTENPNVGRLINALKDEDPRVQAAAAESLGKIGNERAIKHLVAALKEDEPVRTAAAEALATFPAEQTIDFVKLALADVENEGMRLGAVAVLRRMPQAVALAPIVDTLKTVSWEGDLSQGLFDALLAMPPSEALPLAMDLATNGPQVAATIAARTLVSWSNGGSSEASDAWIALARNPEAAGRLTAIAFLHERPEHDAEDLLIALLGDPVWEVRVSAATALEARGYFPPTAELRAKFYVPLRNWSAVESLGDIAVEPLMAALDATEGTDSRLRRTFGGRPYYERDGLRYRYMPAGYEGMPNRPAMMLAHLGAVEAVSKIAELLKRESPEVRQDAAAALQILNDPSAQPALLHAMRDPNSGVRYNVLQALRRLNTPEAVDAIVVAIHDPDAEIRAAAAQALGEMQAQSSIQPLGQALGDVHEKVKDRALESLAAIGGQAALDVVLGYMTSPQGRDHRQRATELLGRMGSAAVPSLVELLNDPEREIQAAAIQSLGDVGDPAGIEPVAAFLSSDCDESWQLHAVRALGEMGPEAIPHLESYLARLRERDTDRIRVAPVAHDAVREVMEKLERERQGEVPVEP